MIIRFAARVVANALGLYVAALFIPGFSISASTSVYLLAGAVLTVLHGTIKPIMTFISFPLIIVTFGLFSIMINALMLGIVDWKFAAIESVSTWSLIGATLVVSLVNLVLARMDRTV
ncbi:MAG: phage holin family protein [Patescibacteria group bacterium]